MSLLHFPAITKNKENHSQLKGGTQGMKEKFQVGQKIRIASLAEVNELVRRRLLDFGITEGSIVLVENKLPFSGPYILEFKGTKIGLRRIEALQIEVEMP